MSSPRDGKKGQETKWNDVLFDLQLESIGFHSFELHTFDHPKTCDACHKLLHGCYFQGYYCPCKTMSSNPGFIIFLDFG